VWLAYLSMGAGFWAKGAQALLPLAAVTAYLILARPLGARASLRTMFAPRHLLTFVLVASPWYIYPSLAYPVQLGSQLAQEAADNLGPGAATLLGHLPFYIGALVVHQLPAIALAAWAWWRNRQIGLYAPRLRPLAWYVGFSLAMFILLFAHHRDRYLLLVVPALALIMAHVIHQNGVTRPAQRLAAVAAIAQIAAICTHSYVVGRPLHELVRYWEQNLRGDLAAHALADRETTLDTGDRPRAPGPLPGPHTVRADLGRTSGSFSRLRGRQAGRTRIEARARARSAHGDEAGIRPARAARTPRRGERGKSDVRGARRARRRGAPERPQRGDDRVSTSRPARVKLA
ncbi:MAG: hypothetical protein IMZ55_18890, partial [Acidobacteria bacterium]|nr:hypothetical protein [Acidobacteriota bacterium]